jgi:hypothetical protein
MTALSLGGIGSKGKGKSDDPVRAPAWDMGLSPQHGVVV